jgi:hypothetical protein
MTTTSDHQFPIRKALRTLMTGLYFPAVLGTGVVFLLLLFSHSEPWWSALGDFRFWFGLLFVLFFSFSFFTITEIADEAYLPRIFACDVAESLLVFWAFGALGLYETPPLQPHRATTYWLFVVAILVENLWAFQIRPTVDWVKIWLSIAAILDLILAIFIMRHWRCGNVLALLVLYLLLVIDILHSFGGPEAQAATEIDPRQPG